MRKIVCRGAAILAGILAFAMLLSCAFVIAHADHDCLGEDCPVCARIEASLLSLRRICAAIACAAVFSALAAAVRSLYQAAVPTVRRLSPFALKVLLLR